MSEITVCKNHYLRFDWSTLTPSPILSVEETKNTLQKFINSNGKINPQITRKYFVKKHNLEDFFRSLLFHTSWVNCHDIGVNLYCLKHGIQTQPLCLVCNKQIKNYIKRNKNLPHPKYCSSKCAGTINHPSVNLSAEEYAKVKIKMSAASKGRKKSEAHIKALSEAQQDKKTQEQRKKTNLNKYGVENCGVLGGRYSKISQQLFWEIYDKLNQEMKNKTYFFEKNREFYKSYKSVGCYAYDFVISSIKFCIEFNGDTWHANPEKFSEDDTPYPITSKITSKEIWAYDKKKIDLLKKEGFTVHIVWESSYRRDPQTVLTNCLNLINKLTEIATQSEEIAI